MGLVIERVTGKGFDVFLRERLFGPLDMSSPGFQVAPKNVARLTTNAGDLIAFTSFRDGDYDIYTIRPDGTGLRRLTSSPGNDAHCAWSPDGKWIAFASTRDGFKDEAALHPYNPQPYGEIYVMRADGSDARRLSDNQYEEATPSWVPMRSR